MSTHILRCASIVAALAAGASLVKAADPDPPPGMDPGGVPVAVVSLGIDYRDPEIAARLARDGEGVVIGWDAADGDMSPFAAPGDLTAADLRNLAKLAGGDKIIPVRIDPERTQSLADALTFIARTPAKSVVLLLGALPRDQWLPFASRLATLPHLRVLVPDCPPPPAAGATDAADLVRAPDLGLANVQAITCPPGRQDTGPK